MGQEAPVVGVPALGPRREPTSAELLDALPVTDWTLRPFLARHRSPLVVGVALALAIWAASIGFRLAFGLEGRPGVPLLADPYFWLEGLNAAVLAYVPTALAYLRRGRARDLAALRPHLGGDDATFLRLAQLTLCVPPARLALSGAVGALLLGAMPMLDPGFWEQELRPSFGHPLMWLLAGRMALTGWVAGHAFASEFTAALSLSRIGAAHVRIDLLDIGSLAPIARASQRGAFAWVLVSSLVSLFWLGPATGLSNALVLGAILMLVTVSFLVAIHGAHRGIVAAKRETLSRLEARIRERGAELVAGRAPDGSGPALADLVAYHGLIERTREWPLGAPALLRGAIIAALALGSWLGGALMEELLSRVL